MRSLLTLNKLGWGFTPLEAGNKRLEKGKPWDRQLCHLGGQPGGDIPSSASFGASPELQQRFLFLTPEQPVMSLQFPAPNSFPQECG